MQELAQGLDLGVNGLGEGTAVTTHNGAVRSEWSAILQRLPPLLATSRPVILAGDFNCITDADGRSGVGIAGGCSKLDVTSRFLIDMVKDAKLLDIFSTPADGVQQRYTWLRPD
eukprot:g17559.t1